MKSSGRSHKEVRGKPGGYGPHARCQVYGFQILLMLNTNTFLFLTFRALVASPKKTTFHGGQSRSWSAEQEKKKESGSAPPPTRARCSFGEKKKIKIRNHAAHPHV